MICTLTLWFFFVLHLLHSTHFSLKNKGSFGLFLTKFWFRSHDPYNGLKYIWKFEFTRVSWKTFIAKSTTSPQTDEIQEIASGTKCLKTRLDCVFTGRNALKDQKNQQRKWPRRLCQVNMVEWPCCSCWWACVALCVHFAWPQRKLAGSESFHELCTCAVRSQEAPAFPLPVPSPHLALIGWRRPCTKATASTMCTTLESPHAKTAR